jgi:hypothetical protein
VSRVDLPGEAWTAGAGIVATVGGVIIERLRATHKIIGLGEQIATLAAAVEDIRRTTAASAASIGDLSRQVAAVDTRIWSHIEHHNAWGDPRGSDVGRR